MKKTKIFCDPKMLIQLLSSFILQPSSFLLFFLVGCCPQPQSEAYKVMYSHLEEPLCEQVPFDESDYFLVLMVNACHLDYSSNYSFFATVAKHPNGCKRGDVGHAWIYLQGLRDGKPIYIEGGHSGETGMVQARYFDGIMNYIDYGYANPPEDDSLPYRYEPNPAKYLWEPQYDGFFQPGSSFEPTFAAKINLTPEVFEQVLSFVENYPYAEYSLPGNQCSSFVAQVAALAGIELESEATMPIAPNLTIGGSSLHLWSDPCYASITFSTPDVLERSLMQAVNEGKMQYAIDWYYKTHKVSIAKKLQKASETVMRFPARCARLLRLR